MFFKLLVVFILVPAVEFFLMVGVAKFISMPLTLITMVVTGWLGAYAVKRQSFSVIQNIKSILKQGYVPQKESVSALFIVIAGIVLLTPGFLTDGVGFLLLIPYTRERLVVFLTDKYKKYRELNQASSRKPSVSQNPETAAKPARGRVVS